MSTTDKNIADSTSLPFPNPDVEWAGPLANSVYQVTTDVVLSQAEYSFEDNRYDIGTVQVSPGKGTLLVINKDYGCHEVLIRLFRERTDDTKTLWYVDVPLSGTRHLHDNGISVCGYKWNTKLPDGKIAVLENGVRQLGFNGGVVCAVNSVVELLDVQ